MSLARTCLGLLVYIAFDGLPVPSPAFAVPTTLAVATLTVATLAVATLTVALAVAALAIAPSVAALAIALSVAALAVSSPLLTAVSDSVVLAARRRRLERLQLCSQLLRRRRHKPVDPRRTGATR